MSARRVMTLLAPIVVAVVIGPLVAGIAVGLFAIASDLFGPVASYSLSDDSVVIGFDVIFAYFIGWPIALLAGLLVSLWMMRSPPSALVVNAAAVMATVGFMGVAATGVLGPVEENNGRSNLLFTLVAAVVAANGCWFLMRPLARKSVVGVK